MIVRLMITYPLVYCSVMKYNEENLALEEPTLVVKLLERRYSTPPLRTHEIYLLMENTGTSLFFLEPTVMKDPLCSQVLQTCPPIVTTPIVTQYGNSEAFWKSQMAFVLLNISGYSDTV